MRGEVIFDTRRWQTQNLVVILEMLFLHLVRILMISSSVRNVREGLPTRPPNGQGRCYPCTPHKTFALQEELQGCLRIANFLIPCFPSKPLNNVLQSAICSLHLLLITAITQSHIYDSQTFLTTNISIPPLVLAFTEVWSNDVIMYTWLS